MSGSFQNESNEFLLGSSAASRDESAFYQAEAQMLTRENQMLKLRIRELGKNLRKLDGLRFGIANHQSLERQLHDMNPASPITHSPVMASNLHRPPLSIQEAESAVLPAPAQASSSSDDMDTSKG
jgi:hypothetical protein